MTSLQDVEFKIIAFGDTDFEVSWGLREEILRKPLGLAFTQQDREDEKSHIHIAGFVDGRLCAACVLVAKGNSSLKMQRVAILDEHRGKGIGAAMVRFCEAYATENGYGEIYCHARESVVPFYLRQDYSLAGDPFIEQTIAHQKMRKVLERA